MGKLQNSFLCQAWMITWELEENNMRGITDFHYLQHYLKAGLFPMVQVV